MLEIGYIGRLTIAVILLAVVIPIMVTCQEALIEVINPSPFDRPHETVEIKWQDIASRVNTSADREVGIYEGDTLLVSQKIDNDGDGVTDVLVFPSTFRAGEKKQFAAKCISRTDDVPSITDVKYILPRKDIAWENDRIAYRIYGGLLAGDVRNGLDVWVKRVRYHIIDKWYNGDSLKGKARISYHVDHGEGADMFNVGKSLGAGACGLWKNGTVHQPGFFTSYRIIATGPIRAAFKVTYESDSINGLSFREEKTYTLDAGENLNRIEVRYLDVVDTIMIAAGLVKRPNTTVSNDEEAGWMSVWGLTDNDSANGYLGTGIIMPIPSYRKTLETSDHYLMISTVPSGEWFTYYAGAGWSRSGDFKSSEDWNDYLSRFTQRLSHPLRVVVSTHR